ncbi:arylsulfatase [Niallia oryzisoli]|uniref:Arylsulfatase n=1 Tax=Niallia oryzisoli TaxID=1737571 RepID=A0ABZ2CCP9_9BACI
MSRYIDETFQGKIAKTVEESTPWWPGDESSSEKKPNVVVILLDDLGFSQLGCYGSTISTPNIDQLAKEGLRYNNFHTTAICSPTRAALLTGRNPHSVGVSFVSEYDSGFPHSRGKIRKDSALLSEVLVEHGYNTFAVGKWHLAPGKEQTNKGPFDNWPLGRGFEKFYGFLPGATNQWNPDLVEDNHRIRQPNTAEEGYHITEDLTDKAISYIKNQTSEAPDKPFFLYLAYGAPHAPHHAPKEFIDKYKGKFDQGWDVIRQQWFQRQKEIGLIPKDAVLPERNPDIKAWDELSDDEKKLYARLQEAFAGFLEHTDYHIGRFVSFLEEINRLEDTLFIFLSDNGACAMGGEEGTVNTWHGRNESLESKIARLDEIGSPKANNHYPKGWAYAGNTPLKWYKSYVHEGGVRDPLIIRYPEKIKDPGTIRTQYHHVTDIVPTVLELLELEMPKQYKGVKQQPVHGTSMLYTLEKNGETRKTTQYYEMIGNRGIWHNGWKAVSAHTPNGDFDQDVWELYHTDADFTEMNNLADAYPEKLQELINLWNKEAETYGVFPLDGRTLDKKLEGMNKLKRQSFEPTFRVLYPTEAPFHGSVAPDLRNKDFEISADVHITEGTEGVILAHGDNSGGISCFIKEGQLYFYFNNQNIQEYVIHSKEKFSLGDYRLSIRHEKLANNQGKITLYANDVLIGEGVIGNIDSLGFFNGMLHIGYNELSYITPYYKDPFSLGENLRKVSIRTDKYQIDLKEVIEKELAVE